MMLVPILVLATIVIVSMSMGVGLMINYPVIVIHVVPPVMLLLSFSYARDFGKKPVDGDVLAKFLDVMMVVLCLYLSFSTGTLLNDYYNTGVVPAMYVGSYFKIIGYTVLGLCIGFLLYYIREWFNKYREWFSKYRKGYNNNGSRYHNYK